MTTTTPVPASVTITHRIREALIKCSLTIADIDTGSEPLEIAESGEICGTPKQMRIIEGLTELIASLLTPLERARLEARRKKIYWKLHEKYGPPPLGPGIELSDEDNALLWENMRLVAVLEGAFEPEGDDLFDGAS